METSTQNKTDGVDVAGRAVAQAMETMEATRADWTAAETAAFQVLHDAYGRLVDLRQPSRFSDLDRGRIIMRLTESVAESIVPASGLSIRAVRVMIEQSPEVSMRQAAAAVGLSVTELLPAERAEITEMLANVLDRF